jgi:hypothetical protein
MAYQGNYGETPLQSFAGDKKKNWSIQDVLNIIRGGDGPPSGINFGMDSPTSGNPAGMYLGENGVGGSPLADRSINELGRASGGADSPQTLFEMLMQAASPGGSRASIRAATAPQRAAIQALQDNLGMIGAQTGQNQADIASWFGQAAGMSRHAARADVKAGRKAARGATRTARGLMGSVADKNVARGIGTAGVRQAGYARVAGNENAAYARNRAASIGEQGAYQQMVQARLGAQAEMDVRSQIAQAQAAKMQAKMSAKSGGIEQMLAILGLAGDNATVDNLLGIPHISEGDEGPSALEKGSALQSALGNVDFFQGDDMGGAPTGDFNALLTKAYAAAKARGLNLNDPQVIDGIRNYIQANVASQYNTQAGTNYHLLNGGFRQ